MTQGELEKLALKTSNIFSELEIRIMTDIVRRIRINGFSTATADAQMATLRRLGRSETSVKEWVAVALRQSGEELDRIFSDDLYREYYKHQRAYQMSGLEQIPFEQNRSLQQLIESVKIQINNEYENITGSMGFALRAPDGRITYSPLMEYYRSTLDNAAVDIQTGGFDYASVLQHTITQMTNSGIRWVDYDSGVHNRVDVAARRAVMTGFRQVQAHINEQVAVDLGTDSYEVSYHVGARPSHQPWQGRVWTKDQLISICGLGSVTGLCGANCYHDYNAFIPGVSVRTYTDEQLEQMLAEENTSKEYYGKSFTTYEALQEQRRMERNMRATRQQIKLLQEGEADEKTIILKKARYQGQCQVYKDFSDKMGLPQQKQRILQDGLRGRFAPTKKESNWLDSVLGQEKGITKKKAPKSDQYRINRNIIDSAGYRRKYNNLSGNIKTDEAIFKYAKAGLNHRDGTDREDLYIISKSGGKILGRNVSSSEPLGVKPNESIINAVLNNQGDLIGLHTHPDNTPPTGSDFETAFKRRYEFGVVACANGSVYKYGGSNKYITARLIDDTIIKYQNMIDNSGKKVYANNKEAHLAALESLRKDYGIWYEAR